MRNKKEEKQATYVDTEIIVTTIEVNKRKEETFEIDAENLTQMSFRKLKLSQKVQRKLRFKTMQTSVAGNY